jgi:hypothetical protein
MIIRPHYPSLPTNPRNLAVPITLNQCPASQSEGHFARLQRNPSDKTAGDNDVFLAQTFTDLCLTLALTCCWKRERRRSGRWKQSGAVRGSARMCAWISGLSSTAVWGPRDPWPSSPLTRGDDPTCCDGHASWDGLVPSQFPRTLLARHAPPLPVSLRSAVVSGATRWTAAQ